MNESLPAFLLTDLDGTEAHFPTGKPAIVCFVKEDCPTCNEVMPVLEHWYQQWGGTLDMLLPGQTTQGNRLLVDKHKLSVPILDDSDLKVSFAYDIDTVPTLFRTDSRGRVVERLVGFVRSEWQALETAVVNDFAPTSASSQASSLEWDQLPEWRPGCGSLSVDPMIAPRLAAEAENSPLRARRVEIASQDDEFEFMFDQGFSDGFPLVPPTPERVMRMLTGTRRDSQEVVAVVAPNLAQATVEKVAINAVMAGCKPEYMPVILAAVEAACTDEYNIHGVMATTMGASPVMVINGPIRHRLQMNMGLGALGQGNRANATMGRALRLVIRNIGGAQPGGTERATLSNSMKFTMCFAEHEERNPWSPYHVDRGFAEDDSVITLYTATSGPTLIVDQDSRTAAQLGGSFGLCLESAFHPKAHYATDCLVVVCPEHVDTFVRDGYSKDDIKNRIQEVTARPMTELQEDNISAVGLKKSMLDKVGKAAETKLMSKFRSVDDIHLVVAGAEAGKFSGAFHGWATGAIGSVSVSRKIEE